MMKNVKIAKVILLSLLFSLVGCFKDVDINGLDPHRTENSGIVTVDATKVCSGTVIAGVTGTANCVESEGVPGDENKSNAIAKNLYVMSVRKDVDNFNWTTGSADLQALIAGSLDRSNGISTSQALFNEADILTSFKSKYQLMVNPENDSDGRCGNDNPTCSGGDQLKSASRKHFLEKIVGRPTKECGMNSIVGENASIDDRIKDCAEKNDVTAFYNGLQYGNEGEGDWKLVVKMSNFEVWQDQRTKLIWSDRSENAYNWYQAAGYSRPMALSQHETYFDSAPSSGNDCDGFACQPAQPISVCAEVKEGELIDQSGTQTNYQANPETAFKGGLSLSNGVIWKLPSRSDFYQAEVNGLRKVLSKTDFMHWTSTTVSFYRWKAWAFNGYMGESVDLPRRMTYYARCVGVGGNINSSIVQ